MAVNCSASGLLCAAGEPQETCTYGNPCDWGVTHGCTSKVVDCACPPDFYSGESTSNLHLIVKEPDDWYVAACGPAGLWVLTVVVGLYLALAPKSWKAKWKASSFPASLTVSRQLFSLWMACCALTTAAMAFFAAYAPSDIWGECSQRDVCVYHQMFCEATRHGSAVRHPANTLSNLPYICLALGLFLLGAYEAGVLSPNTSRLYDPFRPAPYSDVSSRPYQVLDLMFGGVLLAMAIASFIWHGSNCTGIHFIDIGLMNCVIAFFPYRYFVSLAAGLIGIQETRISGLAAAGYAAVCAAAFYDMYSKTDDFLQAFPTGKARAEHSLTALDTALYIGVPGLYPVPTLGLMALRKSWGHVPSMLICLIALPVAFMGHAAEKLVLDYRCEPTSLLTQPTATFHLFTGVAIAAAYVQARALMDD